MELGLWNGACFEELTACENSLPVLKREIEYYDATGLSYLKKYYDTLEEAVKLRNSINFRISSEGSTFSDSSERWDLEDEREKLYRKARVYFRKAQRHTITYEYGTVPSYQREVSEIEHAYSANLSKYEAEHHEKLVQLNPEAYARAEAIRKSIPRGYIKC